MKTKKLLSILLALMMMLSVVPMYASAAEPIALTEANVTVWPTASGEIYYGQKINEGITLSGGEVQYDGAVVAGHFEFIDPDARPSLGVASLKFVPDDTTKYSGFEVEYAWDVMFTINKTTPVLVDVNNPPVATEVEAGAKLSTSTLSGGQICNPYYPEESSALAGNWKWSKGTTIVNESGWYEARITVTNYNRITQMVYVRIAGEIPETTITEAPTVPTDLKYDGVTTWGDIPLEGGKAELKVEGTAIEGTFAVTDFWKTRTVNPGSYEIDVVFTPADPEAALPYSLKIPVTVNKGQIKFVDENGNEIVPEITVPYGTKFNDVSRLLRPYVKGPEYVYFAMGDLSSQLCANGTYTVTATAPDDSEHYEDTELTFKIVVEPKVINPKAYSSTEGYYVYDNSGVYHVEGTFDVYVNDELIASDVAYTSGKVKWEATENGTYTMKWVYNPVENDNFIINDVTTTMNVILPNTITYSGISAYILGDNGKSQLSETTERKQGSSVTIGCDAPAFAAWVITDAKGNAVDLGIEDLTATEITFVMPDYDIVITTKTELEIAAENCDHICHSDNPLFQMLWKVLSFIFRLFDVQQYCDCGNLHYDAPLFG